MPALLSSSAELQHLRDQGVAWMNRGHALIQQGSRVDLETALDAYNEAIRLLRSLPLEENPSWTVSLAAALMNRGQLLHRLHGTSQATLALDSFTEAEALLRPLVLIIENPESKIENSPSPWPRRNLAGTQLNRATLLLDLGQLEVARDLAQEALALSSPHEHADLIDADLALKARRALCDVLGRLIVAPGADQDAIARSASDLVDDGFALARHWTGLGAAQPRELALRLFRFGTQLYRFHQPHFLAEFIRENLTPADAELRAIALEAVDAALADRPAEFLTVGDPASERQREAWRELAVLRPALVS